MDINTDCGSSLSVVLDDISIGGTNITASIREYTFSWGNVNDNDEYISNCHKETIDDVDSTNVIYNKDYESFQKYMPLTTWSKTTCFQSNPLLDS